MWPSSQFVLILHLHWHVYCLDQGIFVGRFLYQNTHAFLVMSKLFSFFLKVIYFSSPGGCPCMRSSHQSYFSGYYYVVTKYFRIPQFSSKLHASISRSINFTRGDLHFFTLFLPQSQMYILPTSPLYTLLSGKHIHSQNREVLFISYINRAFQVI